MARRVRDPRLETRTARLRLPVAHRPVFVPIARGLALGYRRTRNSGTWTVSASDGRGGKGPESKIGVADDYEAADGKAILEYWQAQDLARTFARDERHDGKPSVTVDEALTDYENDLRVRSRDLGNVGRIRAKLPEALLRKSVVSLT